jgi:hypothetical protein
LIGAVYHGREAFDVGKQRGQLTPLAAEFEETGLLDHAAHHDRRKALLEAAAHPRLPAIGGGVWS